MPHVEKVVVLMDEQTSLVYANNLVSAKDSDIMLLEDEIRNLRKELKHEQDFADNLNDLNIQIKRDNARLKDKLKVTVLPTALVKLASQARDLDNQLRSLRKYLILAIDLIPDIAENKSHISELRKFYDQIA